MPHEQFLLPQTRKMDATVGIHGQGRKRLPQNIEVEIVKDLVVATAPGLARCQWDRIDQLLVRFQRCLEGVLGRQMGKCEEPQRREKGFEFNMQELVVKPMK